MSSRPFALLTVAVLVATVSPAAAQDADPDDPAAAASVAWLSRAGFHLSWEKLVGPDRRFRWLAEIGVDLDLLDYRTGRIRLRGDYEAVIGRERRRYDLNQGHYFFELSASREVGDVEIAALVQHVSRHLVDRENPPAISWNEIGARVRYGGLPRFVAEVEVGRPWDQALVDYTFTSRLRLTYDHPFSSRASLFGAGTGRLITGTAEDRQKGSGGRLEAGIRLRGDAAIIELLIGYERRVDAYPTERGRVRWITLGFRVTSR